MGVVFFKCSLALYHHPYRLQSINLGRISLCLANWMLCALTSAFVA